VDLDALPVGTVFLVHENDETAKLRLLHVEEAARGHGIGNTPGRRMRQKSARMRL
jgi:hypothetical protein